MSTKKKTFILAFLTYLPFGTRINFSFLKRTVGYMEHAEFDDLLH
jgi:hypothetical protein